MAPKIHVIQLVMFGTCYDEYEVSGLCASRIELKLVARHSQELTGDGSDFGLISKRPGLER